MHKSPAIVLVALLASALSGCDAMKKMIDPSGAGYRPEKPDTSAKAKAAAAAAASPQPASPSSASAKAPASATPAPAAAPAPAPPNGRVTDAPIRTKAAGRFLTRSAIDAQIDEISFLAQGRGFHFSKNLFRDKKGITSLRDSSGRYWGLAIGDLNMDGSDDAVLVLRTDAGDGRVAWDLAYLPNRNGRLFNVQTLELPGDQGYRDLVIEGSGVILVPAVDGPSVHLGYAGGELSFVAR